MLNKIKSSIYVFGAILLVIKIFFENDLSNNTKLAHYILSGITLTLLVILEIYTRRK